MHTRVSIGLVAAGLAACADSSGGGAGGADSSGSTSGDQGATTTTAATTSASAAGGEGGLGVGGSGDGGDFGSGAAAGVGGSCAGEGGSGPCDEEDPYVTSCVAACDAIAARATALGCAPSPCPENCGFRSETCEYPFQDLFGCLAAEVPEDVSGCVCGDDGTIDCSAVCTDMRDLRTACRAPIDAACAELDTALVASGCIGYGEDCFYSGDATVADGCGDEFFARTACLAERVEEIECHDGQIDNEGVCQEETDAMHDCEINGPDSPFDSLAGCELAGDIDVIPGDGGPTDGCEARYACDADVELIVDCDGENDGTGTSLCTCHIGDEERHVGPVEGEGEEACENGFAACLTAGPAN